MGDQRVSRHNTYHFSFILLLSLFWKLGGGLPPSIIPKQHGAKTTYYINEYHVHSRNLLQTKQEINSTEEVNRLGNSETSVQDLGNSYVSKEEHLRAIELWINRINSIESKYISEQNRRLQLSMDIFDWMQEISPSGDDNKNEIIQQESLNKMLLKLRQTLRNSSNSINPINDDALLEENRRLSDLAGQNLKSMEKLLQNRPTQGHRVRQYKKLKPRSTTPPPHAAPTYATPEILQSIVESLNLSDTLTELQSTVADLKEGLHTVKVKYNNLHRTHRRLASSHRQLQRDYLKKQEKERRMQTYLEFEFAELKRKVSNETSQFRQEIQHIAKQVQSLATKQSRFDESNPGNSSNPVFPQSTLSNSHEKNTQSMGEETVKNEGQGKFEPNPGGLSLYSDRNYTAELVEAGFKMVQTFWDRTISGRPKDCSDIDFWSQRQNPVQTIYLVNKTFPVQVRCEEGWTIIQRYLHEESVQKVRKWVDYKTGFGDLKEDNFWIGNEYLYLLSNQDDYQLQIDMRTLDDYETLVFSRYSYFRVSGEADWYRIYASDYSGTAGDILGVYSQTSLDKQPFAAIDKAYDKLGMAQAELYKVGWWYPAVETTKEEYDDFPKPCFTNLNYPRPWICSGDSSTLLSSVAMKVKPDSKD